MDVKLQHRGVALPGAVRCLCCSVVLLLLFLQPLFAQNAGEPEEVGLMLHVPRVGSTEISALMRNDTAYFSIVQLFDYLKVRSGITPSLDTVSGFLLNPSSSFILSLPKNLVVYGGRFYPLSSGALVQTAGDLFLRADFFGSVFGLDCEFDFRSLSVTLKTKLELPVIREMQQEMMRKNISQLRGERKADTTIGRERDLLRMGTADWAISTSRYANGLADTRLTLTLGAQVFGGETTVALNASPGKPVDDRMQSYRWRYVNNDNRLLRQVSLGKMTPEAVSTLLTPVRGFQLSNTPTTYRKSFGTYTISNTTQPGWIVELYVNNILVNYTKADASGFYTFDVPMVYGSSNVKLRFFGPWGEEQTKEETVVIPFNFLPVNQLEYTLTSGVVKDSGDRRFTRLNLKYGLGRFITVGGGMEYFTAVRNGRYMPFATAAMRLFNRLILYGEHTHGVRTKGILNYRHRSNLQLDINYTAYVPGQTAVRFMEEQRAVISMPFRGKKYSAFSRLAFSQMGFGKQKTTSAELLVSAFFSGVSSNFSTYAMLNQPGNPLVRSNLSLTVRLPRQVRLTQQMQYEYAAKNLSLLRTEMEKAVFKKGFLNLSLERNMAARTTSVSLGLRFNLGGVQASFYGIKAKDALSVFGSVRGSFLYDDNIGRLQFSNQGNAGRGALSIMPFLDLNCNGRKDEGEPKVCGMRLRVNGGRMVHCNEDTTIQVLGLEAYANYLVEVDKTSFDNVAWQVKKPLMNVVAEPNYFKRVEVPVAVVGEVSGRVSLLEGRVANGQERMIVHILRNGQQVARVLTEPDGFFSFMGLAPGRYTAALDKVQLAKLDLKAGPAAVNFTIRENPEGDLVEGLAFLLEKNGK